MICGPRRIGVRSAERRLLKPMQQIDFAPKRRAIPYVLAREADNMTPINTETFLNHAASVGIGFDPKYPQAQSLIFLSPNEESRFWVRPEQPSQWPKFVAAILDAAGANGVVYVKPRRGTWPSSTSADTQLDRCQAVLAEALGIPLG